MIYKEVVFPIKEVVGEDVVLTAQDVIAKKRDFVVSVIAPLHEKIKDVVDYFTFFMLGGVVVIIGCDWNEHEERINSALNDVGINSILCVVDIDKYDLVCGNNVANLSIELIKRCSGIGAEKIEEEVNRVLHLFCNQTGMDNTSDGIKRITSGFNQLVVGYLFGQRLMSAYFRYTYKIIESMVSFLLIISKDYVRSVFKRATIYDCRSKKRVI